MSYIELFTLLITLIGDVEFNANLLCGKVQDKQWDRSKAYVSALKSQVSAVEAMIATLAEVDRTRPPTDPGGVILPKPLDD